jgi:hypothetical protein
MQVNYVRPWYRKFKRVGFRFAHLRLSVFLSESMRFPAGR